MNNQIRNILIPLIVIVVAVLAGAKISFTPAGNTDQPVSAQATQTNQQELRLLTIKAPGMFCLGCSTSVENYLSSVEGVRNVSASLGTKKVEVVYDPLVVTKETILANQILDVYGKEILSDKLVTSGFQTQRPPSSDLPYDLALKLQDAAAKVSQLPDKIIYQDSFDQIDQAIAEQDYQQAGFLLDQLLADLGLLQK